MKKNKKILTLVLVSILSVSLLVSCDKKEEVTLGFNVNNGEKYDINSSMDMDIKMKAQGAVIEMPMKMEISQTLEVKDKKEDKTIIAEETIDKCTMSMEMFGQKMVLDTEASDADSQTLKDLFINKPLTMTIDPQGEISDVKYPEELMSIPEFKQIADSQKETLKSTFAVAPKKKIDIKVGSKWSQERTTSSNGQTFKCNEDFEIVKIENGKVYIESVINMDGELNLAEDGTLVIDGTGSYVYNEETGMIEAANAIMNFKGKVTEPTTQMATDIEMKITMENTVTKK